MTSALRTYDIAAGDILACYGTNGISRAIEWLTWGPSHVAQIAYDEEFQQFVLWESTTLCDQPDLYLKKPKQGVQAHEPFNRIYRYPGKVLRLRPSPYWKFTRHDRELQQWLCKQLHAATYDYRGAGLSGTRLMKFTDIMPYPNYNALFCSEFCAATLMRLQRLPLDNPRKYNPAGLVRALRRTGVYSNPVWLKP